jgi:hypothetical protein
VSTAVKTAAPRYAMPVLGESAPALIDMVMTDIRQHAARVWAELESGAVVRALRMRVGGSRHFRLECRGWLTRVRPTGASEVQRRTPRALREHLGVLLDGCARGETYEFFREADGTGPPMVIGYLSAEAPECYAAMPLPSARPRRASTARDMLPVPGEEPRPPEPWELTWDRYCELSAEQRAKFRARFETRTRTALS